MNERRGMALHLAVLVSLASCAGPSTAWRQVDEKRLMISVTGRLEVLEMPAAGDVRLEIAPRAEDRYALASGQERLGCIVHSWDREDLETMLLNLELGQTVRISGYWTATDEAAGTRHYLNDTTSIEILD